MLGQNIDFMTDRLIVVNEDGSEKSEDLKKESSPYALWAAQLAQIPNVPVAALRTLYSHQDYLMEEGFFPLTQEGQPMDMAQLATLVSNHFKTVCDQEKRGVTKFDIENTAAYGDLIHWLLLGGILHPNLAGDWEVDRTKKGEESLGIKDFGKWEAAFAHKYRLAKDPDKVYRHLEMGPGNGAAMQNRRVDSNKRSPGQQFEQYGLADKIYFPIDKILKNFLKPEVQEDSANQRFIELLGYALRLELKSRWFKADGNVIGEWKQKVQRFDLNIIYELLKDPKPWLHKWYNPQTGMYKVSQDFENQREEKLDYDIHRKFLEMENFPQKEKDEILIRAELDNLASERKKINKIYLKIEDFIMDMDKASYKHLFDSTTCLDEWVGDLKKIVDVPRFYPYTAEGLMAFAQTERKKHNEIREGIKKREKDLRQRQKLTFSDCQSPDLTESIFVPPFVQGIQNDSDVAERKNRPNLNRHASVSLENFTISDFLNVDKYFPPKSLFIISGIRSLSHLPDDLYEKVIRLLLPLLKPGGHVLDDGVRHSYSRAFRFDIIQKIMDENPDYQAFAITDKRYGEPKSAFIQRESEEGYAPDIFDSDEQQQLLGRGCKFEELDHVVQRPDLQILNQVRRDILKATSHNVNVFKAFQDVITDQVYGGLFTRLKRAADIRSYQNVKEGQRRSAYFKGGKAINRAVIDYVQNNEFVSVEIIEDVRESVSKKIDALLRSSRLIDDSKERLNDPRPGKIYTLPVVSKDPNVSAELNQCYEFPAEELPTMKFFGTPEAKVFLEMRKEQIKAELFRLKELGIASPIGILGFKDCVTNDLLREKIQNLLGEDVYDDCVRYVDVSFDPQQSGSSNIEEKESVEAAIDELIQAGGLLVSGGSWHDSPIEVFYRLLIGKKLLKAIEDPQTKLRMFNICFSSQVWLDLIGAEYWNGEIKTQPGMLEIGPVPLKVLPQGQEHPLFSELPNLLTVAATHSGHVVNKVRNKSLRTAEKKQRVIPLAVSNITGHEMAWSNMNGNAYSVLFHPDAWLSENGKVSNDVERICAQLKDKYETGITERFGQNADFIRNNFDQILDDSGNLRIQGEAGDFILANGIYALLKSIA